MNTGFFRFYWDMFLAQVPWLRRKVYGPPVDWDETECERQNLRYRQALTAMTMYYLQRPPSQERFPSLYPVSMSIYNMVWVPSEAYTLHAPAISRNFLYAETLTALLRVGLPRALSYYVSDARFIRVSDFRYPGQDIVSTLPDTRLYTYAEMCQRDPQCTVWVDEMWKVVLETEEYPTEEQISEYLTRTSLAPPTETVDMEIV